MRAVLALALLAGCSLSRGPWVVQGVATAEEEARILAVLEEAQRQTQDEKGWLAHGGTVWTMPDVDAACGPAPAPGVTMGCAEIGRIWVRWPHPAGGGRELRTVAHEACHLGTAHGGGPWHGPLLYAPEADVDACGARVMAALP